MTKGKSNDELKVGDSAQISKIITEEVTNDFARSIRDFNPVYLDQACAEGTSSKGRSVHGLLSVDLGNILPGHGTIYLFQEVKFLVPVRIGDRITAKVGVVELIPEKIGANSERPV